VKHQQRHPTPIFVELILEYYPRKIEEKLEMARRKEYLLLKGPGRAARPPSPPPARTPEELEVFISKVLGRLFTMASSPYHFRQGDGPVVLSEETKCLQRANIKSAELVIREIRMAFLPPPCPIRPEFAGVFFPQVFIMSCSMSVNRLSPKS
jgi:hypothetical protein